jgi:LPS export ABC transporter protein LptC
MSQFPRVFVPGILFIFPASFLLLGVLLSGCEKSASEQQVMELFRKSVPTQESWGVTYLYTDSGKLTARLNAPYLREVKSKEQEGQSELEMTQGLTLTMFNKISGEEDSHLNARYGKINQQNGIAEARGSVELVNAEGARLETEELFWNREKDLIYTQKFVKITTKDEILYGDGLEANSGFNTYRIFKIRGTIKVKE